MLLICPGLDMRINEILAVLALGQWLLQSIQFLYLITGFTPHQTGLIAFQCSLCSIKFRIFILPGGYDEELVVLISMAAVSLAYSGYVPGLTHCVEIVADLVITFARVTWNYGPLCEFRPNCVSHQQGSKHKDVHFALWRNKPSRA
jgi:hypothetical protein